jgi:hypothetical protein
MRTAFLIAASLIGLPVAAAAQPRNLWYFCGQPDPGALSEKASRQSGDPIPTPADKAAAAGAVAKADALRARLSHGDPLGEPYDGAERWAVLAEKATDPELAELFRRVAMDQFSRSHMDAAILHRSWAEGLSPAATSYAYAIVSTRDFCGTDEGNTAWLEKALAAKNLFKRSTFGDSAANAAFLLVQHADLNRPFQRKALAMMEPLMATGDVRPQNYALLFDRVAVGEGRPQRYGSQGGCTGPGVWTEKPVEDAATLDQTRAKVGLEPIAAYRTRFVAVCGGAAPPAPSGSRPG